MVYTSYGEANFIPLTKTVRKELGGSDRSCASARSDSCTVAVLPVPGVPDR